MRTDAMSRVTVKAYETALVQDPLQVFGVGGVVTVVDLHSSQVNAFFLEDFDLTLGDVPRRKECAISGTPVST